MELPVVTSSNQPSAALLIRALKRIRRILANTLVDEVDLDGAVAFASSDFPGIHAVNFVSDLHLPEGPDSDPNPVVQRVLDHYRQAGVDCHLLQCAESDWPQALLEMFRSEGYSPQTRSVRLLSQYAPSEQPNANLQIIPGRASYAELRDIFIQQHAERLANHQSGSPANPESDAQSSVELAAKAAINFLDDSRLELYLGRLNQVPVGYAGVISLGDIGVIHDVYVTKDHRRSGIGTSLMAQVLDHCQRAQFDHVLIEAAPHDQNDQNDQHDLGDPRDPLLDSLGFKEVATFDQLVRQ